EARARPGKDLPNKIEIVLSELFANCLTVQEDIREFERRQEYDKIKRADT
ncbi:unnamed protein product, partial [marine sediment metagenome]